MRLIKLPLLVLGLVCFQAANLFSSPYSMKSIQSHVIEKMDQCNYTPWFAGTLLEPSSTNQDAGHVNLQPYFFYSLNYGEYRNNWSFENITNFSQTISNVFLQIGLTKHVQLESSIQTQSTFFKGKTSSHFSDLVIATGIQLLWDEKGEPEPNFRIVLGEVFPTGTYDFLDPFFEGNDASGKGAYTTNLTFDVSKIVYAIPCHPMYLNASVTVSCASPVRIHGVSVYGGDSNTNGKLSSRFIFEGDFSFEFSFTQNWVLACDLQFTHVMQAGFSGITGPDKFGDEVTISSKASSFLTLTPAIEYNFKQNLGLIVGGSFSLAGRNTTSIAQGIASLTYTF